MPLHLQFPQTADFVIIGGGVMGASTAYHLALAGAKNVLLLEREPFFGQGATGRCAGGVRYQFATEVNIRLSMANMALIERFQEETGQACDYHPCGYLFVLTRPEDVARFEHNVALQHRLGVETEWLTGDEVRQRLPLMVFPDALAGTFHQKDGLADPNGIVMGYIKRARQMGATAITDTSVTDIITEGGRVTAVQTNQGLVQTSCVINATGPWAGQIGQMAGVEIPITPLRRQMITTTPLPGLPPDFPFVIDFAQSLYFHREGEGILTGMSNPHETPGFDQSIDHEWEMEALGAAIERLPLLEQAGRMAGWAGLYEVTPDAHPIFGPTPLAGFWLVTGFSGHGFMHGPIAGKLMAEWILEGKATTVDVSSLDLARFAEGRLIVEYNVI
jgi:sarcosine oxidase, subunit beta